MNNFGDTHPLIQNQGRDPVQRVRDLSNDGSNSINRGRAEPGPYGCTPTQPGQFHDASNIDSNTTCELDAEGHCITCSDEALTARVLSVDELMGFASVTIEDALDEVDITLLDEVAEGDLLLVHGGVAIAKVGDGHPQGDAPMDEANNA